MSITTYDELKTAIGSWLNRSDLTAYIPDFIMICEKRIYRNLRIRAMEASLSSAIASGVIAVPSGYVQFKHVYVDGTPVKRLTVKDAGYIYENYPLRSADGRPEVISREVDNFIFGPYPDSAYTIKGTYYKRLDALSVSNTTNWFTTNAPDLLLFGSLAEAEPFLKNDERVMLWEKKYLELEQSVQNEDDAENYSGSPITITVSNQ